jgi:SAM-dependent methyltransferase
MQNTDIDRTEVATRQEIENEFWRSDPRESPESNSIGNIINKVSEAAIFLDCLDSAQAELSHPIKVLELGAGQGWASCLVKRQFPQTHVTATDISEYAIKSLGKWEQIWQLKIDDSYSCKSYETRESDASVDLVFCFAAAHHFLLHHETLREIHRILKPGGKAFYFYEPTSPKFFYAMAYRRVNRKRPHVPEDVLVVSQICELARANHLHPRVSFYPSVQKRGPRETLYYYILSKVPLLCRLLPCTANFVFEKQAAANPSPI